MTSVCSRSLNYDSSEDGRVSVHCMCVRAKGFFMEEGGSGCNLIPQTMED